MLCTPGFVLQLHCALPMLSVGLQLLIHWKRHQCLCDTCMYLSKVLYTAQCTCVTAVDKYIHGKSFTLLRVVDICMHPDCVTAVEECVHASWI